MRICFNLAKCSIRDYSKNICGCDNVKFDDLVMGVYKHWTGLLE